MSDILYKSRSLTLAKAFDPNGTSDSGIFYDFAQNKFYFKGFDGQSKTLNNQSFNPNPITPTNPELDWQNMSNLENTGIWGPNTITSTFIKFDSALATELGYSIQDAIDTISFPITAFKRFTRPQSNFNLSIKVCVFSGDEPLTGDWSNLTYNEIRDYVIAANTYYSVNYNEATNTQIKPGSQYWRNYESKDFFKIDIPNLDFTEQTIVVRLDLSGLTQAFDTSIINQVTTEAYLAYQDRFQGQDVVTNQFVIPFLFNI